MESELITYKKFDDRKLANELAALLDENEIEYTIEEQSSGFDSSLVIRNAVVDYTVKIKGDDFELVDELLYEQEADNTEAADQVYYLFNFTDDELMEVVAQADEWNSFDVEHARKLLAERGKSINDEQISKMHDKRIEELRKPAPTRVVLILVGYLLALSGGILGLLIGRELCTSYKKLLPNGEMVNKYGEQDRFHGKAINYLSLVVLVSLMVYWVGTNHHRH